MAHLRTSSLLTLIFALLLLVSYHASARNQPGEPKTQGDAQVDGWHGGGGGGWHGGGGGGGWHGGGGGGGGGGGWHGGGGGGWHGGCHHPHCKESTTAGGDDKAQTETKSNKP